MSAAELQRAQPSRLAIATVYFGAMMQGMALVSFAASGPTLRDAQHLSDAQYGLIFLPQVVATIIGAVFGGNLAARIGMQRLLWIALLFDAVSQLGLSSMPSIGQSIALPVLLASTAAMGLGFGLMGSPMNGFPPLFFPNRASTATVAIHCFNGGGLVIGPLLLQGLMAASGFAAYPLMQAGLAAVLALAAALAHFNAPKAEQKYAGPQEAPPSTAFAFWILAAIAIVYSFAEGTFGNWATIYLQDGKHLSASIASAGLSVFWLGVVVGRLLVSLLVLKIPERWVWRCLPLIMIAAFLLLPYADTPALGIGLFALAGLGCSAFYPLTVALATGQFPRHLAWVSAMMIAALMVGNGLGSFLLGLLHAHLPFETLYRASIVYPGLALLLTFFVSRKKAVAS